MITVVRTLIYLLAGNRDFSKRNLHFERYRWKSFANESERQRRVMWHLGSFLAGAVE